MGSPACAIQPTRQTRPGLLTPGAPKHRGSRAAADPVPVTSPGCQVARRRHAAGPKIGFSRTSLSRVLRGFPDLRVGLAAAVSRGGTQPAGGSTASATCTTNLTSVILLNSAVGQPQAGQALTLIELGRTRDGATVALRDRLQTKRRPSTSPPLPRARQRFTARGPLAVNQARRQLLPKCTRLWGQRPRDVDTSTALAGCWMGSIGDYLGLFAEFIVALALVCQEGPGETTPDALARDQCPISAVASRVAAQAVVCERSPADGIKGAR